MVRAKDGLDDAGGEDVVDQPRNRRDITSAVSAFVSVIVTRALTADQPVRVRWSVFRTAVIEISFLKTTGACEAIICPQ